MEHKNGNDSDFFPDDDFDKMLEEKTRGWDKDLSTTEILDSQKIVPQVSDQKIERVGKEPISAESVVETSNEPTSSTETHEDGNPNQSLSVPSADAEARPGIDPTPIHASPITTEEVSELLSDPAYSRDIIEGKIKRTAIRGMATGPWANQHVVEETVSEDQLLDKLGHTKLAEFWREITREARENCKADPDKLLAHIEKMQDAAFWKEWELKAYQAELNLVIMNGNETERKKAEIALSRIWKDHNSRVQPDGSRKKAKASGVAGEDKPKKVKALAAAIKTGIDMLHGLNFGYDQLIERYKVTNKLDEATLNYINEKYGRGESN